METEPPINLTYALQEAGGDEVGHTALLSWTYPLPSDLQYGWITLQYELQYRRASEPDNWKVRPGPAPLDTQFYCAHSRKCRVMILWKDCARECN